MSSCMPRVMSRERRVELDLDYQAFFMDHWWNQIRGTLGRLVIRSVCSSITE